MRRRYPRRTVLAAAGRSMYPVYQRASQKRNCRWNNCVISATEKLGLKPPEARLAAGAEAPTLAAAPWCQSLRLVAQLVHASRSCSGPPTGLVAPRPRNPRTDQEVMTAEQPWRTAPLGSAIYLEDEAAPSRGTPACPDTVPLARRLSIWLGSKPSSRRISTLCSPKSGASACRLGWCFTTNRLSSVSKQLHTVDMSRQPIVFLDPLLRRAASALPPPLGHPFRW
jgi:hypothetical protein